MHVAAEQFSTPRTRRGHRAVVLFPNLYLWLVFFASLDIILTRVILFFSGVEMNPIAQMVIEKFGVPGMAVFKFAVVSFVIIVCEVVGRTRRPTAQKLAVFAVLITGFPVVWSSVLVGSIIATGELPLLEDDPARHRSQSVEYAPDSDLRDLQHGRVTAWITGTAAHESSSSEAVLVGLILPRH
jgi:hypothetical protein